MTSSSNKGTAGRKGMRVLGLVVLLGVVGPSVVWAANVAALSKGSLVPVWLQAAAPEFENGKAPKTPEGLPQCAQVTPPVGELPHLPGETIRYIVDIDGLSVGTVDFKIERRGMFQGLPVVEYRSLFKLDSLVATFIAVEGRAAVLVPSPGYWPSQAMNRYRLNDKEITEDVTYSGAGHTIAAKQVKDGQAKEQTRLFPTPVQDFVSAFYLLRRMPPTGACTVIYGNERAYTVWLTPDGQEEIKTPGGLKMTDRLVVRYASDKATKMLTGHIWLGQDADRLPYQAELDGAHHLEARIHLYQPGR